MIHNCPHIITIFVRFCVCMPDCTEGRSADSLRISETVWLVDWWPKPQTFVALLLHGPHVGAKTFLEIGRFPAHTHKYIWTHQTGHFAPGFKDKHESTCMIRFILICIYTYIYISLYQIFIGANQIWNDVCNEAWKRNNTCHSKHVMNTERDRERTKYPYISVYLRRQSEQQNCATKKKYNLLSAVRQKKFTSICQEKSGFSLSI